MAPAMLFLAVCSCATTKSANVENHIEDPDDIFDVIPSADPDGGDKYLFLRLYDTVYKNPLYVSNLLKLGIKMTEVNGMKVSHSSVGFDLNDNFFGLTMLARPMLSLEHCGDVSTNKFMKECDPQKSTQITYAIKVTPEEYNRAKEVLIENREARYTIERLMAVSARSIRRGWFTSKAKRGMAVSCKTRKSYEEILKRDVAQKEFICSSFIAYVFYRSVDDIKNFFEENKISWHYITVSDLALLPGMERLFDSSWAGFDEAARDFALSREEFTPYRKISDSDSAE